MKHLRTFKKELPENSICHVISEVKIFRGSCVITIRPNDILRVIGYSRFGEVCARFDDCADTPALHDAFFGRFYIEAKNVVACQ